MSGATVDGHAQAQGFGPLGPGMALAKRQSADGPKRLLRCRQVGLAQGTKDKNTNKSTTSEHPKSNFQKTGKIG
jgi:hypothetical protein